jgi:hypothetical protein
LNDENNHEFADLIELARSIPTENDKYFRMHQTQHDKSPLLLLCQVNSKSIAVASTSSASASISSATGLKNGLNPVLLRAVDDLLLYKWEQRDWRFGDAIFTRMKADYIQTSGKKKIEVTLKILKHTEVATRLNDFLQLSDKWAKIDLSEIVRMHALTLHHPIALVLESINIGPLDEFLRSNRNRKHIKLLNLVETAYSLAKALHYLVCHVIKIKLILNIFILTIFHKFITTARKSNCSWPYTLFDARSNSIRARTRVYCEAWRSRLTC